MESIKELKIEGVQKKFIIDKAELEVLSEINLNIIPGEFISIVGSSGCGKSTLLKMIAGLEKPSSGDIIFGDKIIKKPTIEIGMIFQESRLFPWLSVEKNIEYGIQKKLTKLERKELIQEHINLVSLTDFEKALPKQLSGGMQQRVSIARTLINSPAVLLLDEPFGALDALTSIQMQNELLKIRDIEKNTMILVTHDIDEAIFLSDRIVIMSSRPGGIQKIINVNIPRPRDRSSLDFINIRKEIYGYFFENSELEIEYYL